MCMWNVSELHLIRLNNTNNKKVILLMKLQQVFFQSCDCNDVAKNVYGAR